MRNPNLWRQPCRQRVPGLFGSEPLRLLYGSSMAPIRFLFGLERFLALVIKDTSPCVVIAAVQHLATNKHPRQAKARCPALQRDSAHHRLGPVEDNKSATCQSLVAVPGIICNLLRPLIKILCLLVPYGYIVIKNKKEFLRR